MPDRIPTYSLQALASPDAGAVFFPDYGAVKAPIPLHQLYRGDYYKISLCLRGEARLRANRVPYTVVPDCLVLATPDLLKEWDYVRDDYQTLSVFFTPAFIAANNGAAGRLRFLLTPSACVVQLSAAEAANIAASFRFLQQKYRTLHPQRENVLHGLISSLLYEIGGLYERPPVPGSLPRSQQVAAAFRALVQAHGAAVRNVAFYAAALCITPKHLAAQVQAATGRPPRAWIAEAVLREAQALLQNPALSVGQVAASLHFADAFAFSRFFKAHAGVSPSAYRQPAAVSAV